jgi:hypothetical protein
LLLWFLRGQDQRLGPIKSINIKTEIAWGWGGTPRKITSSLLVQSAVRKNVPLFRSFLIHCLNSSEKWVGSFGGENFIWRKMKRKELEF